MSPARRLLALLLLGVVTAPAAAQRAVPFWWNRAEQRTIGRYHIMSDLPADQANGLARHLNMMHAEYTRRLGALPPRAPEELNVLMFRSQRDYELTLRVRYGIDGRGTGGMFFVTANAKALALWTEGASVRNVRHVLQHEGFHQFAFFRFGADLPTWVNEGLAEFFGESVLVGETLVLRQSTPRVIERVKTLVEMSAWIPFRDLLAMTHPQWNERLRRGDGRTLYAQSWSMVHFLVQRHQSSFEHYLRLLNRGVRPALAFTEAFGADIDAFESQWAAYARQAEASAFVTALERIEFLASGMLHLHRQGTRPTTLDDLRSALQEIGFRQTMRHHALEVVLDADDAANFVIPGDELTDGAPLFLVEPNRRIPLRERGLEPKNPRPASIRTTGLRPYELRVEWIRDLDTNTFSYRVQVEQAPD